MPIETGGRKAIWLTKGRRLLPPVISSFLCFVFVVIRPLSDLGGQYAFLCFTALLLFCFPAGTVGNQLEATVLGVGFIAVGLAWTVATLAVAAYCGRTYGADCGAARAVIGAGLALIALVSGFLRSYAPRLAIASRIGLFFPVFVLTAEQNITNVRQGHYLEPFYVALFAAAFGLAPIAIIAKRSSGSAVGVAFLSCFATTRDLLPLSVASHLESCGDTVDPSDPPLNGHAGLEKGASASTSTRHARLNRQLRLHAAGVDEVVRAYSGEIAHTRLPPTHLVPIGIRLHAVTRNPLLGSAGQAPGERIQAAMARTAPSSSRPGSIVGSGSYGRSTSSRRLSGPVARYHVQSTQPRRSHIGQQHLNRLSSPSVQASEMASSVHPPMPRLEDQQLHLADCICTTLTAVGYRMSDLWAWTNDEPRPVEPDATTHFRLVCAIEAFEAEIALSLDLSDGYSRSLSGSRSRSRMPSEDWRSTLAVSEERDDFRLAFHLVALLDLARDTLRLFDLVQRISAAAPAQKRWHVPYLPTWLKASAATLPTDILGDHDTAEEQLETSSSAADPNPDLDFIHSALRHEHHHDSAPRGMGGRALAMWRRVWDDHRTLHIRIGASRLIYSAKHSRHITFGFKLSLGMSLLSIPALMPPGTPGRIWFETSRGSWMVLSYLYVLDVHTGAIFRIGFFRIIGTFLGAVASYIFTLIARENPYALVTLATACSIPIAYMILFTTYQGIGTVAGITLPPLLFINYLDLDMGHNHFFLAWNRFVNIAIGIIAAVLVGSTLWPDHARIRYLSAVSITLERLTEYYLQLSRDNLRSTLIYQNDRKIYSALDGAVRQEINGARMLVAVQRNEVSLLPRPIRLYAETLDACERLLEAMIEVRLLRFSVPRKETVLDVLPLRSDLVSAILVNLWACSQAFRSRSPLPQFLPDPRAALDALTNAVDEHHKEGRGRSRSAATRVASVRSPSTAPVSAAAQERRGKHHLAVLYAMAENEALMSVCDHVAELVATARTLFGTQSFLSTPVRDVASHG